MDHDRINLNAAPMSCAVLELSRISEETEEAVYAVASRLYHPSRGDPCAICAWSDLALEATASSKLAAYITQHKLGIVYISPSVENPRTGNIIYVGMWTINHTAFKEWYKKQRLAKLGQVGT